MSDHDARRARNRTGANGTHRDRRRRSVRRAAGLALAAATAVGAGIAVAPPAAAEPECLHPSYDFDQDGEVDSVVGAPADGSVEVRFGTLGEPRTEVLTGDWGFGTAVTQLTSYEEEGDDELCSQLVVGSPYEDVPGKPAAGAVYVYYYDLVAEEFVLRGRYTADSPGVPGVAQAGAEFGASLASSASDVEVIDPRPRPLRVGSPGQDVDGARDAGRVTSFTLGARDDTPRDGELLSLATPGAAGDPTPHAALGRAISERAGLVAVGIPRHRVRGVENAGAVLLWLTDREPDGLYLINQGTPGMPGTPEQGDRFGTAVHVMGSALGPYNLVVGVPREDVDGRADAGSVAVGRVERFSEAPVRAFSGWNQNSPGMRGSAEAGDRFGTAVSSMFLDRWRAVVGVPDEDLGSAADAGMVQVVGTDAAWTQSTAGVPGAAEAGDRFGARLSPDPWVRHDNVPQVGVPGEDGATGGVLSRLPISPSAPGPEFWRGPVPGARYGLAVAP
ncbi:hypothetical protein GCM10009809_27310 [Isoptericola hypogeus]|uniref:Uncharacterized protein n=1 Tax=Isoptericola hypogeus TaxID=300179 RepID=A0ABN2JKD3_9MICO